MKGIMETLVIDTGEKRIAINGDPDRVIVFNPSDVVFAEKFYALQLRLSEKNTELETRAKSIDANKEVDANGIPVNFTERAEFFHELHKYMCTEIDSVFGEGTSQKVFGDFVPPSSDVYEQFFNGIKPFINKARTEKIAQYTTTVSAKRNKRK